MCPPSLRIFEITSSGPSEEVERILEDTLNTVIINMELLEYKFGSIKAVLADPHERWKLGHPLCKISGPLTTYVI